MLPYNKEKFTEETVQIQSHISIAIATWNLQGTLPSKNSVRQLMEKLIQGGPANPPDIINIATQQCQKSLQVSFFCQSKDQWENLLNDALELNYMMVDTQTLQGLHSAIFVKKKLINCYTRQGKTVYRAGFCNLFGNKGAITITCNLLGQNIQFINCHLAPHQNQCQRRNQILLRIVDNLAEQDPNTQVFLCGDLNYRIQMTKQQYYATIKGRNNIESQVRYTQMIDRDQLRIQQTLKNRFFNNYVQAQIRFPPTYKISPQSSVYNQNRIPGWTDRIFMRKGKAEQLSYSSMYNLYGSDHRPVISFYNIEIQEGLSLFPEEFIPVTSAKTCQLI